MIAMRGILALLFVFISHTASAQQVEVISGEHADFSRLVMQFEGQPEWAFGRVGDGYALQVDVDGIDFDTSAVFTRIPKTRILDVEANGHSRLLVHVAPDVHADVFELRAGRVVIDIKDGKPRPTSLFEAALPTGIQKLPPPKARPSDVRFPDELTVEMVGGAGEVLASFNGDFGFGGIAEFGRMRVEPSPDTDAMNDSNAPVEVEAEETTTPSANQIEELEKSILEGIARATADGLLEPSLSTVYSAEDVAVDRPAQPEVKEDEEAPEEPDPHSHLSITSATQRARDDMARDRIGFTTDGDNCILSERIDVAFWGRPLNDGIDLPRLRAALVDELDKPVETAMIELAKYYIYLTFGAEAQSILRDLPRSTADHALYRALASIVEGGLPEDESPLVGQFSCNTHAALWSVLARPHLQKGDDVNVTAVMQTFNGLPPHLRLHLGQRLAARFIELGEIDAATQVENTIGRAATLSDADKRILDARLAAAKKDYEREADLLEAISLDHAMTHPKALIRYVDVAKAQGRSVSRDIVSIAEVITVEYRGHALEPELARALINAKILNNDFTEAFADLERLSAKGVLRDEMGLALERDTVSAIIERGGDGLFLRTVFPRIEKTRLKEQDEADRKRAQERLLALGFDDVARRLALSVDQHAGVVSQAGETQKKKAQLSALSGLVSPRVTEEPDLKELDSLLADVSHNRQLLLELLDQ